MKKFPGARWWKFDFHTHTPASKDYGKGPNQASLRGITPEEWLLGYMRACIDCVAVTDHNSGTWIDQLKESLKRLEQETHPEYRPLYLFPGVEITANGGVHILAILDFSAGSAEINRLLGAVHSRAEDGTSDVACDLASIQVVTEIAAAGGITVLAHVDDHNGLFQQVEGNTLTPILDSPSVYAIELREPTFQKPTVYNDLKIMWAEVLGSDSHHPDGSQGDKFPGSHYTWVKMGEPSLEGLRLALLDNAPLSIRRCDQYADNPNIYASLFIEELHIEEARYCGHGEPLVIGFNPWLNAIIGGRGSGKSTLVEFMRIALQREDELPESLVKAFGEFNQIPRTRETKGALTEHTKIKLLIHKDGTRYAVQWCQDGSLPEILQEIADSDWQEAPGDVRQRFPVRVFSQKQVYALSEEGEALLKILDETTEVNKSRWDDDWKLEQSGYLSLMAKSRELQLRLGETGKIKGELDDVLKKLKIFEGAEHAKLFQDYQSRKRQAQALMSFYETLESYEHALRDVAEKLIPPEFERVMFDAADPLDAQVLSLVDEAATKVRELSSEAFKLAERAQFNIKNTKTSVAATEWAKRLSETLDAYKSLVKTLQEQGVTDPSQYDMLVTQRQNLEARLKDMSELSESISVEKQRAEESLGKLIAHRKRLTSQRMTFLTETLGDNRHVRIRVVPFGRHRLTAEQQFRAMIDRLDGAFANDILTEDQQEGLIAGLYDNLPRDIDESTEMISERLVALKADLLACASGQDVTRFGARFTKHLRQLQPETLDRIRCWFPEDTLSVEYSPKGDGRDFKPLEQGSPGQKTAAILAFLLAHGNEPIILDQPEDDLDNHLIYDLIVSQVRENKLRRQVIVITHNPNIVVNGDAEAVFALDQRGGQCRIVAHGCLQSIAVRDEVCRVMEGGREAFEKRYKRIISSIR